MLDEKTDFQHGRKIYFLNLGLLQSEYQTKKNRFKFRVGKPQCLMCTINVHAQTDLLTQLVEVNEALRNDKPLGISHSD